jgi:hypothetical protein
MRAKHSSRSKTRKLLIKAISHAFTLPDALYFNETLLKNKQEKQEKQRKKDIR